MKKTKYQKCGVGSCSNRVIELNLKMLIPLSTIYTEILLKVALNTKKPNQTINLNMVVHTFCDRYQMLSKK